MLHELTSYAKNLISRATNYIETSRLSTYYYQWHAQFSHRYVIWLMKQNGIETPEQEHPIWHHIKTDLTPRALKEGIAIQNLYLVNRDNFLGLGLSLKIRGFTFMVVGNEQNYISTLFNVPARYSFKLPKHLLEAPSFASRPWDDVSKEEKIKVKNALLGNTQRLWLVTKNLADSLETTWQKDKSVANNLTMLTFNIVTKTFYGCDALDPTFYDYLNHFEQIWLNPEEFTVTAFEKVKKDFRFVSQQALVKECQEEQLPAIENDVVKNIYDYHAKNTTFFVKPESFNAAALLSITGNLPRLMIILARYVLTNPELMARIQHEKMRLKEQLESKGIELDSEAAFKYILNHSELFMRIYFECLRFTMNIATVAQVFRLNTNLLYNQKGAWKINDDVTVLPRTLAVLPQQSIVMNKKTYANPLAFDVDRTEYVFKETIEGVYTQSQPLVFGDISSPRVCPGRELTRKLFMAMMWWMSEYNKLEFSTEVAQDIPTPNKPSAHVSLEQCLPQKGILLKFENYRAAKDELPEAKVISSKVADRRLTFVPSK